jgi:membrane protease YdiL (CAAX protease family)
MSKLSIKFLLYTFILTFSCWGGIILANQFGYLIYGTPISMIIFLLGGLSPTIVAYFSLKSCGKVEGFKDFFKQTFHVKQPTKAYLLVITLLAIYLTVPAIMGIVTYNAPIYILPLAFISSLVGGGLEELGWRFILQYELEKKFSFTISTIITAAIWAVWHLPLFFILGTSQNTLIGFAEFSVLVVGFSFVLATVYKLTKSIWLCVFCHALINSLNGIFLFLDKISIVQSIIMSLSLVAVSFIAIKLFKNRLISNLI